MCYRARGGRRTFWKAEVHEKKIVPNVKIDIYVTYYSIYIALSAFIRSLANFRAYTVHTHRAEKV